MDILPVAHDLSEGLDLVLRNIDEEVLSERWADKESVQGAARYVLACGSSDMHTRASESINVDVIESALLGEDRGIGGSVLPDDVEFDLRPVPDIVKHQSLAGAECTLQCRSRGGLSGQPSSANYNGCLGSRIV